HVCLLAFRQFLRVGEAAIGDHGLEIGIFLAELGAAIDDAAVDDDTPSGLVVAQERDELHGTLILGFGFWAGRAASRRDAAVRGLVRLAPPGCRGGGTGLQDEAAIAIRALDEFFVAHVEIDARMSERGIAPVAGDDAGFDLDGFGRLHSVAVLRKKGTPAPLPW